jgi:chromosomal replication initiator protein
MFWEGVLQELRSKVTKPNWETWLKDTVGFAIEGDKILVLAASEYAAEWLTTKLKPVCAKAATEAREIATEIEFVVAGDLHA